MKFNPMRLFFSGEELPRLRNCQEAPKFRGDMMLLCESRGFAKKLMNIFKRDAPHLKIAIFASLGEVLIGAKWLLCVLYDESRSFIGFFVDCDNGGVGILLRLAVDSKVCQLHDYIEMPPPLSYTKNCIFHVFCSTDGRMAAAQNPCFPARPIP